MGDASSSVLKKLSRSFTWEARMLYVVALGVPAFMIHKPAGLAIGGVAVVFVVILDTVFSVLITGLFLRPILEVLGEGTVWRMHQRGTRACKRRSG